MQTLTKNELSRLIALGEGFSLEFKRTAAHLGREICAFANSAGGRVLRGLAFPFVAILPSMRIFHHRDTKARSNGEIRILMTPRKVGGKMIETLYPAAEYAEPRRMDHTKTWFAISFPRSGTGEVTGEVKQLLKALVKPMGRGELQEILALKSQANFRDLYLVPALNQGLIERTIPDKPTSRLQKYRITEKGKLASRKG